MGKEENFRPYPGRCRASGKIGGRRGVSGELLSFSHYTHNLGGRER